VLPRIALAALLTGAGSGSLEAADRLVASNSQLQTALQAAVPGDRILLAPGIYAGGLYRAGLEGVTLTSQDPAQPAVLDAGGTGEVLHLSSARDVVIEDLIFRNYLDNGINIDDGGNWPAGKSANITLGRLTVSNATAPTGNRDAIKLSGVEGFVIDGVVVTQWGTGGSAIDPVGSHRGVIRNSQFVHDGLTASGSGVRPKGGSKDIQILGNRFEMNAGRAIQLGGSTGAQFFRFVDGDSGYEAAEMDVAGNLIRGADSAVHWVNIDGGRYRFNAIDRPTTWIMRMLNENPGSSIVDTQGGQFWDNVVVYDAGLRRISNHDGAEVLEETFSFARNQWYRSDGAGPTSGAQLQLPAEEVDGTYGVDPQLNLSRAVTWHASWGLWVVNPHAAADTVAVTGPTSDWLLAVPGSGARWNPIDEQPFAGEWDFRPLTAAALDVGPWSQSILAKAQFVAALAADFNRDGRVDDADLTDPETGFAARFGIDLDGSDLLAWQRHRESAAPSLAAVPEPGSATVAGGFLTGMLGVRKRLPHPCRLRRRAPR
jgi:hypothetical protein